MALEKTNVRQAVIDQLAYVRACEPSQIEVAIQAGDGDLEIDSKEGQVVAIRVELVLNMDGLIRPEDQKTEHLTTVSSLTALIERRSDEHENDKGA